MLNPQAKIVVVVPAFNEGRIIEETIEGLGQYVDKNNIVVVDDGSWDGTFEKARESGAKALRHIVNCGAGAATKTGIDFALNKLAADIVITFDADSQHDPADIEDLVKPFFEEEVDVVIGSRFLDPAKNQIPYQRVFFNRLANFFTYLFFGVRTTDSQSGFKAFSRPALGKIKIRSNTFEFCSEIFSEIKKHNLKFKEIPIRVKYSKYSLSKGQNSFKQALRTFAKVMLNKIID